MYKITMACMHVSAMACYGYDNGMAGVSMAFMRNNMAAWLWYGVA
jgi:hypothetical protein